VKVFRWSLVRNLENFKCARTEQHRHRV